MALDTRLDFCRGPMPALGPVAPGQHRPSKGIFFPRIRAKSPGSPQGPCVPRLGLIDRLNRSGGPLTGVMESEIYDAFLEAGVSKSTARAAAEAIPARDVVATKQDLARQSGKLLSLARQRPSTGPVGFAELLRGGWAGRMGRRRGCELLSVKYVTRRVFSGSQECQEPIANQTKLSPAADLRGFP